MRMGAGFNPQNRGLLRAPPRPTVGAASQEPPKSARLLPYLDLRPLCQEPSVDELSSGSTRMGSNLDTWSTSGSVLSGTPFEPEPSAAPPFDLSAAYLTFAAIHRGKGTRAPRRLPPSPRPSPLRMLAPPSRASSCCQELSVELPLEPSECGRSVSDPPEHLPVCSSDVLDGPVALAIGEQPGHVEEIGVQTQPFEASSSSFQPPGPPRDAPTPMDPGTPATCSGSLAGGGTPGGGSGAAAAAPPRRYCRVKVAEGSAIPFEQMRWCKLRPLEATEDQDPTAVYQRRLNNTFPCIPVAGGKHRAADVPCVSARLNAESKSRWPKLR